MEEIWKEVKGYEGLYQVSNLGRVKSVKRNLIKKMGIGKTGYHQTTLSKNKKATNFYLHTLVAQAFLGYKGYKETGLVVDHIDNDKSNNKVDNLQLITFRANKSKDLIGGTDYPVGVRKTPYNTYRAEIRYGKKVSLGSFKTVEEAEQAYKSALGRINKGLHPKP